MINLTPKIIKLSLGASLLLPLIYISWTIYPSHFGKTIFFQILIDILFIFAFYYFLFKEKKIFKLSALDWAILAFLFVSLASTLLSDDLRRSFWGDQGRVQGAFTLIHFILFYFLLRFFLTSKEDWSKIFLMVGLVSFLSSIIAWFGPSINFLAKFIPEGSRLSGLIANPIFFANYLMLPTFLSFFSFFYFKEKSWRWIWLISGAAGLITILGTQTRGPLLGLASGLIIAAILYLIFGTHKKEKIGIALVLGIILLFVSLGYIFPSLRQIAPARLSYIYSVNPFEGTGQTRLMAWQIAVQGWKERPVFGWGLESYQDIFDKHYNPDFLKYSFAETVWDQPHNYVLEILSSRGVVGLVLYLFIVFVAFRYPWQLLKQRESESAVLADSILIGGLAAYIIQLLFSFETSNSWQIWFLVLAFLPFLGREKLEPKINISGKYIFKIIFAVAAVLVVVGIYENYLMLRSSYYTSLARDAAAIQSVYYWQKYAEQAINFPAPFKWDQAIFLTKDLSILDGYEKLNKEVLFKIGPEIEKVLLDSLKENPKSYWYRFWLGQLYIFMGEYVDEGYYAKAEIILREAGAINPDRQHIPLLLAKMAVLQRKNKLAIEILTELTKKDPGLEQPHWFLGVALVGEGQVDKGIEELQKGENFGLGFKNNIFYLIDLYAQKGYYDKIVPLYERLIAAEPKNATYYARLAATYAALKDREGVIRNLNKAVELDPSLMEEAQKFLKDNNIKP